MSYQQITIIGNLGNDPEMRFTPAGVPVCSFSIAVNRTWNDANGAKQEKTTWFRVTCWRKLAEIVSQYATKGSQVLVVGEIEDPRIWTDKEGTARSSLEITAQNVRFLGSRGGNGEHAEPVAQAARVSNGGGGRDEDIPF